MIKEINPEEWFYIVRENTNECFVNRSGHINVCTKDQIDKILPSLNFYEKNWEAMTIRDYNIKFRMVGE